MDAITESGIVVEAVGETEFWFDPSCGLIEIGEIIKSLDKPIKSYDQVELVATLMDGIDIIKGLAQGPSVGLESCLVLLESRLTEWQEN